MRKWYGINKFNILNFFIIRLMLISLIHHLIILRVSLANNILIFNHVNLIQIGRLFIL